MLTQWFLAAYGAPRKHTPSRKVEELVGQKPDIPEGKATE